MNCSAIYLQTSGKIADGEEKCILAKVTVRVVRNLENIYFCVIRLPGVPNGRPPDRTQIGQVGSRHWQIVSGTRIFSNPTSHIFS